MRHRQSENSGVFARHIAVLDAIAEAEQPQRFADLLVLTGLSKATLHRLLQTMTDAGLIRFEPASRSYHLGMKLVAYANAALRGLDLRKRAEPHLEALRDLTGETTRLAVLDGTEMIYVDHKLSPQPIGLNFRIGGRGPAYCSGTGKAVLAFLPPEQRAAILAAIPLRALTKHTIAARAALEVELDRTRQRGYAIDDQEQMLEVRALGAPILDRNQHPLGAISVTVPAYRVTLERLEAWAPEVVAAAQRIKLDLGH